jgi:hypothetical protein
MFVISMWQTALGILAALGLSALLARQFLDGMAKRKAEPSRLFADVMDMLDDARIVAGPSVASHRLIGHYHGLDVQVQTVADTLSVRKLPSLWLMVTIADPLPVKATFDMMLRAAGHTTFSNFDHLPHTLLRPADFPEHATVRSDDPASALPAHVVTPHLQPFFRPRAKELLISPKGLRMVVQLGEADRARYGVFRQAEFGGITVEPQQLMECLNLLVALRKDIQAWAKNQP